LVGAEAFVRAPPRASARALQIVFAHAEYRLEHVGVDEALRKVISDFFMGFFTSRGLSAGDGGATRVVRSTCRVPGGRVRSAW